MSSVNKTARSLSLVGVDGDPPSLLDDDPFANLTCCVAISHSPHSPSQPLQRAPKPSLARPRSSGHGQVRPAHTRPAIATRPSLPSLYTLAQMNMSIPTSKIRKGTPGARLPHEPWDMDLSAEFILLTRSTPSTTKPPGDPTINTHDPETINDVATDETSCSRSLSSDDADTDSLPSLSDHSSSTLSRSSSSPQPSVDFMDSHDHPTTTSFHADHDTAEEDDPLSYHSDFDYYTKSFSDPSDSDSDLESSAAAKPRHHAPPNVTATPYTSLYDPVDLQTASSPDSMPKLNIPPDCAQSTPHTIPSPTLRSPRAGDGWRGHPRVPESQCSRRGNATEREVTRPDGGYSGRQASAIRRPDAADGDNDRDKARRGKPRSSVSSTLDDTSSSDDDADSITVYYSLDGMSNGPPSRPRSRARSRHSKVGGGSDDDVPLAQRVPTALSAQKSIRKQLHDERQQRRLERARSSRRAPDPPLPCPLADPLSAPALPARFRKRSVSAAPAPVSGSQASAMEAFPVEDLTRKLLNLQTCSRTQSPAALLTHDNSVPTNTSRVPGYSSAISRSSSRSKYTDHAAYLQQKTSRPPETTSQPSSMRPFHRPDGRHSETSRSPIDQTSAPRLGRSATAAASSRTARAGRDVALEQHPNSGRVSEDGRQPSASVPRSSIDRENDATQRAVQRPSVPPLPISDSTPPQHIFKGPVVQQRIFIGDMQRFNMVEITPATNAGDVIDTVARQGMLDRSGSWMVFELAQDYGMERPVRDYELLADVSASWNKDKLLNAFVIKQTPLTQLLGRSALPTSSPTYRGWVEWESKRGKWNKRWMELREHGLWLSKRDTGKDEVFLCSLSNFDAYYVTRRHKSPKAFVFAIKSTDHLSLFENAADYLHVFSCNPRDGEQWMRAILVARSYVLFQERNVLFAKSGEALSQAKLLTRSRTRKQSVSSRPAQPLVNVPPPFSQAPTDNVAFEPGSLLAKRKGDAQP